VKIIENVLPVEFIKNIQEESKKFIPEISWRSNLSWDKRIVKSSSLVLIRHLDNVQTDFLKNRLIDLGIFPVKEEYTFKAMTYLWSPLSYIPWHEDKGWKGAATIYINQSWDENWGGYIMWEDEKGIHASAPSFNRMAVNSSNVRHCTTLTTKDAELRETIQMFWF
jgi:hypothetical protein